MSNLTYEELLRARQGARGVVADAPCPICGTSKSARSSKRRVMRTWLTSSGVITYCCARCDAKGHVFPDAERRIETPSTESVQSDETQEQERQRKLKRADEIWKASVPIVGTPGAVYLASRGIALDRASNHGGLRWHPRCPLGDSSDYEPCVLVRYTDAITGEPRGIRRRPVRQGEKARTLGPMGGCVIRLWPDEDVTQGLCIGEGLETALFAATRIVHHGTLLAPMWAAGSAGNLETFPVLPGIEALTILVDNDVSGRGQEAAKRCADRWQRAGREVILRTPKQVGADFNDLAKVGG
jgi:hypothetical protein